MEEYVYCGICGFKGLQLYSHIREAHNLGVEEYMKRCPKAPLFSESFGSFAQENRLSHNGTNAQLRKNLFGVDVNCTLEDKGNIPEIDNNFIFDERVSKPLLLSMLDNDRVLLVGHTGCGKSSVVEQISAQLNWPVRQVNLNGETSVSDFTGQWVVEGKEMVYRYGILPQAMKQGDVLVLEELDSADPGILFVLQGILEENGKLILTENGSEVVEPHKDFRIVATANTLGLGDESGLYTGTHVLNQSHLDRWTAVFNMGYLPQQEELKVIQKKVPGIEDTLAEKLVRFASSVRKAFEEEQVFCTFSTRKLLALAAKSVSYENISDALQVTVLNRLGRSDAEVVNEIAQRHLALSE